MFKHNVAVVYSSSSRDMYARQAQQVGETYEFVDALGRKRRWLKGEYAYLAPNAACAVLNRFNIKHDVVLEQEVAAEGLKPYHTIIIPNAGQLAEEVISEVVQWARTTGNKLFVTGKTNLPLKLLGISSSEYIAPVGYSGWRWTRDSPFTPIEDWGEFYISSWKGYTVHRITALPDTRVLAELLELVGDTNSASAPTTSMIGDGILAGDTSIYVANQVFEYLGGVMQGHINVEDVRMSYNPTHWAETLAYFVREVLKSAGSAQLWSTQLRAFGCYDGVLQLRHDCDHGPDDPIDLAMLEYETENAVPATYYVLDPSVCPTSCTPMGSRTWVEETSKYSFIECGLHNDSAAGCPPTNILGKGLYEHIRDSDRRLGIVSRTAGRHMGFFCYPETIDAMDYLYEHHPTFLGLCTFSLFDVIAYGDIGAGPMVGDKRVTYTTYNHEDPSRPAAVPGFWFPYHVVVSTRDEHKTLRGWNVTHDTDCSYERIDTLFEGQNARNPRTDTRLPNGVFTLHYLPQGARDPTVAEGRGFLPYLRYAIAKAESCNLWLASKRMLYERMNDFQDLRFRVEPDGTVRIHNPTDRPIQGLMVSVPPPLTNVTNGELFYIHIVKNRFFTVPPLNAGECITLATNRDRTGQVPAISQPNTNTLSFINATYDPVSLELEVTAIATRQNCVLLRHLPPDGRFDVTVDDHRGRVQMQPASTRDGTLAVTLFGPEQHSCLVKALIAQRSGGREE